MIVIGIDPGHGGEDSGAAYPQDKPSVREKDLTLAISRRLYQAINGAGWDALAFLTRDTDEGMSFATRRALLEKNAADFVISIHCNAADPKAKGLITFYKGGDAKSQSVAEVISRCAPDDLLRLKNGVIAATNLPGPQDDWTKRAWNVMTAYQRPSVLIECGFLSNTANREALLKSYNQSGIVAACMAGIAKLLSQV